MIRFILLLVFFATGLTSQAQFWHRKPKPAQRAGLLLQDTTLHLQFSITPVNSPANDVVYIELPPAIYNLELAEALLLKEAKHNMRFRMYNQASYSFSNLGAFYLKQNRFSEAKWYLLQSNTIVRPAQNTRHLLDNLLSLADIKCKIGETALAMVDLQEAHDVAIAKGMQTDLAAINTKIKYLQSNKTISVKAELRYAEAVEAANSKNPVN